MHSDLFGSTYRVEQTELRVVTRVSFESERKVIDCELMAEKKVQEQLQLQHQEIL
jgi:hypothetical protein